MDTERIRQRSRWLANSLGVLVAVIALGIIGWYVALGTHLVQRPSSGFFFG